MSRVELKIGLATTLLLLIAVTAMGSTVAQQYDYGNKTIVGNNVSVKTTDYFNESVIGTALEFQIVSLNTSANSFSVSTNATTNATTTLTNGSWFWVNATRPGVYWVNVSNAENSSEYVNFTVVFKAPEKLIIEQHPPYYANAEWYNVTVRVGAVNNYTESFVEAGVPVKVCINDTSGDPDVWVANNTDGSDTQICMDITGHGNFRVLAFGPEEKTVTFNFTASDYGISNQTTVTFLRATKTGWITGQFRDVSNNEVYATPSEPIKLYVTSLVAPKVTKTFNRTDGKSFYTIEVPAGNYSVTAVKINATTGKVIATGSVVTPVKVQENKTTTADIVFTWVVTPKRIEIYEDKHWALANGQDRIKLTIKAWGWRADKGEVPLAGAEITVTTTLGILNGNGQQAVVTTNENGEATVILTSEETGSATVTAYISNYQGKEYRNINDSVQKLFVLYGNGAISGEVRLASDNESDNAGAGGVKVWIHPCSVMEGNYVNVSVPPDTTYVRILRVENNSTSIVPYDYYVINPAVIDWIGYSTDVVWCLPVVMGTAGEGYNVTMNGHTLGVIIFEPGNYTIQYTTVSKDPMNLTDDDFRIAGNGNVTITGNLTYEYALEIENTLKEYTGKSNIDYATVTADDGGYSLSGIYGDGSNGVMYVVFAEKDGFRRAFKIALIEDVEPYLAWVWPDDTDFVLLPRVVPYTYKLELKAKPSIIPTEATSNVTATLYRKPALSIKAEWEPVMNIPVTLEIVRNNTAANESSWLNDGYVTTVSSGTGVAVFKAGQAIGTVWINGTAKIVDEFGTHVVNNTTKIIISEFAEISGYVTNESGIHLEGWAKAGKIAVAIWTYNESAHRKGIAGPTPKYCELLPTSKVDQNALDIIARYYNVAPTSIRFSSTYGGEVIPANPRLAATDAGYTFAHLLAPPPDANESYRYWVAAYVDTGDKIYFGYSLVEIRTSGTHTANIVVRELTELAPKMPDLTVESIDVAGTPVVNETVTVKAKIANVGDADAGAFNVSLYADDTLVDTKTVESLTAGNNTTVEFNWTPDKAKTYELKVVVDTDNAVKESNENNNEMTKSVTVKSVTGIEQTIHKYYPSGNVNSKNDVLQAIINAINDYFSATPEEQQTILNDIIALINYYFTLS